MMFRLRRLYFDSIGVPENRFSDLMVDLSDLSGEPIDTIVWLRNGAGKTTMLSLLLALVLPDRRDFLAHRTKKRTLEDLVLPGDTAHVVAEWVDPAGQLLLTGAVYEWDGRTRPADYNGRGKDRLQRTWWCVHPDPDVEGATLDDLPFTLRSNGRYDREHFIAHIRSLATLGVNAVVASQSIGEWHTALRERRFDPDLFRYFAEVNAAEGGMDGLFADIDSPGRFVRYLLRFVGDYQRVEPVRDLLSDTAVEIAKRPIYSAQRLFCAEAAPRVAELGVAYGLSMAAIRQRDGVLTRAAGLKRALLDAEREASERHRLATEQVTDLDGQIGAVRTNIDHTRRKRDEYTYLAAEFEVAEAQAVVANAKKRADAAAVEARAWGAAEHYVVLQERRAQLEARRSAYRTAADQARPLLELCDEAKARLAAAIGSEIEKITSAIGEMTAEKQKWEAAEEGAGEQWRQAVQRVTDLTSETDRLHSILAEFDKDRLRLVTEGVITDQERLTDAEGRLRRELGSANSTLVRLQAEHEGLDRDIDAAKLKLAKALKRAVDARADHTRLTDELARTSARAAELGDDARLRSLLQVDRVDLELVATDATAALAQAIATTDKALAGLHEEAARGDRAIRSLKDTELLPPRLAVEKAIDRLEDAGITAVSGWRYLAEHVPSAEHDRYMAELPEVIDGVIVYGGDGEAALAAERVGAVDDLVVVSAATAFTGRRAASVVLVPPVAQHDTEAGIAELENRTRLRRVLLDRIRDLAAQRDSDLESKSAITAWLKDLPADGIAGLRERTTAAGDHAADMGAKEENETDALNRLEARAKRVESQISDTREQSARLEGALRRVERSAEIERDQVEPGRIRLTVIPRQLERAHSDQSKARQRQQDAADHAKQLDADLKQHSEKRVKYAGELESLPEPLPHADLTVAAARAALDVVQRQLDEQFPQDTLQHLLRQAETEAIEAGKAWSANPDRIKPRAMELAHSPDGADRNSRVAATERAEADSVEANTKRGEANARLAAAESERDKARSARRGTVDIESPTDREHAEQLAEEAISEMTDLESRRHRLEGDRQSAASQAGDAKVRADMLHDQTVLLREVAASETSTWLISQDSAEVRSAVQAVADDIRASDRAVAAAEHDRNERADSLSRWAGRDDFVAVAEDEHGNAVRQLREMFRDKARLDRVAENADELVRDLHMRENAIAQQLKQVELHKSNVVTRMIDLVDDALSVIARASTLSELPEGIGPWTHQRFLAVEARARPSRDQIGLRVGELIDAMVGARRIETDPAELLWRATEAAVPEGFRATVLKPAPDQPTGRIPVEEMRKWSGGENLTASLVLFCVLARLRAERRAGSRSSAVGGLLPLDNPVGKANYLPFLDLQRKVARACGVQLVFWTGIGDLGAVTTFPRIVAMHKRPSATRTGRAYVQVDAENTQVLDVVSAVRDDT
ncbi:hypothetical protein GZH49_39060 [Nocardia terpenica]|uniref:hypothetical protein n=1 Tax=Nocardia terpenica TaxID=455432 RepID=UPI002FE3ED94